VSNVKPPVGYYVFAGDCEETLQSFVILRDEKRDCYLTLTQPREIKGTDGRRYSKKEVERIMFAPGDGRVTRRSLLAETFAEERPADSAHKTTLPIAHSFLICLVHGYIQDSANVHDEVLSFLVNDGLGSEELRKTPAQQASGNFGVLKSNVVHNREKIMLKRIASMTLVTLIVFTFCRSSAYARASSEDEVKPAENTATDDTAKKQVNGKLRADMLKLVADAKAGKVAPAPRTQMQPEKSNNLSKGAKIAIGVGIAVAVIAIIVVVKADKGPTFRQ
jgi:hypothetical protein